MTWKSPGGIFAIRFSPFVNKSLCHLFSASYFNWLIYHKESIRFWPIRTKSSRLVSSPICEGISPNNLLNDWSRSVSLDRLLISIGTIPKSPFILRSRIARLGRDENENPWSVPFKPELVKFNPITLPAWLQEMPNQLHWDWAYILIVWRIGCIIRESPWNQGWLGFILKSGFPIE